MPHKGARVLYIDDDAGLRRLAQRVLTRRGFVVATAESGVEGLQKAANENFDLIAVDHYMPGMDGLQTLERIRAMPDPPPVVYVTGTDEGRVAVAALKAGAADYVVKAVGEDFLDLLATNFEQVLAVAQLAREKQAAESRLVESNSRLEALLAEVNHRVANSLQLVAAMVRMQAAGVTDPAARTALSDTDRRIAAIAQVHRRLYTSSDVEAVDMREYLGALVTELGETWSLESEGCRVVIDAEPIRLPTDRAISLGVIVTELVTNACKYAYPQCVGEVRVALTREGEKGFVLAVEDDGVGMVENAAPQGTGVGTKLIRAMAQSLQTIVEYDRRPAGVRAVLRGVLA